MDALREALAVLADDERLIANRLDFAVASVNGMGKNIATAILLVSWPELHGVWNIRSEAVMKPGMSTRVMWGELTCWRGTVRSRGGS